MNGNNIPKWLMDLAGDYEKEILSSKRLIVSNTFNEYPNCIVVWCKDTNKGFVHDMVLPVERRKILLHVDLNDLIKADNLEIRTGKRPVM